MSTTVTEARPEAPAARPPAPRKTLTWQQLREALPGAVPRRDRGGARQPMRRPGMGVNP